MDGLAALPRRGAVRKLVPGFSAAVIVYECEVPFSIPCGSAIVQANSPLEECQEQYAVVALIPGPARVTRTCFAVPIARPRRSIGGSDFAGAQAGDGQGE